MTKCKFIMVIDDNENDIQLVLMALGRQNRQHELAVAHNGAEAMDYLRCNGAFQSREKRNPDVIFLDLKMPCVDGLEVLQQIKSDPDLKTIPVIMLTSSKEESDVFSCYQLGVNAYVVKPMDFSEFMGAIKETEAFWTSRCESPPRSLPRDPVTRLPGPKSAVTAN